MTNQELINAIFDSFMELHDGTETCPAEYGISYLKDLAENLNLTIER